MWVTYVDMTTQAASLRTFLDGPHAEIREMVRAWLSLPGNAAVVDLPREEHRAKVLAWARELADITSLRLPGCFAMTETGHGSNVQALRTTATYDDEAGEFVIHTPDADARKDYIGNAARDGRMAAVFAQLIV